MEQEKSLQFMQIAMKYLPEAKEAFEQSGIELSMDLVQPFMTLFTKVMNEAYELGVEDAKKELNRE
nr:ComZ family protein [Neobacillus sp. Marseille-Q6967]